MTSETACKIMELLVSYCDAGTTPARRRWIVRELKRLKAPEEALELTMSFRDLVLSDARAPLPHDQAMHMGDIGTRLLVLGLKPHLLACAFTFSD